MTPALRIFRKKINLIVVFICLFSFSDAQTVKVLTSGTKTSIRGLSVVNDKVIWASGSNGKIGLSTDSGNTWKWNIVKGFEKSEFRDIEAFDEKTAVIMGITEPAVLLRTKDGGANWDVCFFDSSKTFLDAMEFWNEQSGIVIGDPSSDHFFIARTFNGGKKWRDIPFENRPVADSGEACFASSGTNIRKFNKREAVFVSGGMSSNLFYRDQRIPLPIKKGTESTGANSLAIKNKNVMMVVGGDFNAKDSREGTCAYTIDGGNTWNVPEALPSGYRSCVEYIRKAEWITCGLNGVDITTNDGKTFFQISKEGFHVCRKAKKGNAVFFAGGNGKIAKLIY